MSNFRLMWRKIIKPTSSVIAARPNALRTSVLYRGSTIISNSIDKFCFLSIEIFVISIALRPTRWYLRISAVNTCLKFCGNNNLPIRGHDNDEGVLMNLLKLRSQDLEESVSQWISRARLDYLSHDIQNELLQLMAHDIQRKIASKIQKDGIFFH